MQKKTTIAIVGTFDSKAEEHFFLKNRIEQQGLSAFTINVGTRKPSPEPVDLDLYNLVIENNASVKDSRDKAIAAMIDAARAKIKKLYADNEISGMISAGGGTGTHIATSIMHELPLGVPKVMVSTVASRNMAKTVGTKDITMIHSVADLLGVNSDTIVQRLFGGQFGDRIEADRLPFHGAFHARPRCAQLDHGHPDREGYRHRDLPIGGQPSIGHIDLVAQDLAHANRISRTGNRQGQAAGHVAARPADDLQTDLVF